MVISALFNEVPAEEICSDRYGAGTRLIRFWLHQPTRITEGHVAVQPDGTSCLVVNWSSKGKPFDIAERARYDAAERRADGGMTEWDDARLSGLLADMEIEAQDRRPTDAFSTIVLAPLQAAERKAAERLSIQWEVDDSDLQDAIGLRYQVVQKAEAILNDAGLLVDQAGTVVADDTVSVTLEVSEFGAAKSLLWNTLTMDERRFNCRIDHG